MNYFYFFDNFQLKDVKINGMGIVIDRNSQLKYDTIKLENENYNKAR